VSNYELAHEFLDDLRHRPVLLMAGVEERLPQLLVDANAKPTSFMAVAHAAGCSFATNDVKRQIDTISSSYVILEELFQASSVDQIARETRRFRGGERW
jgi:hypothetical protein